MLCFNQSDISLQNSFSETQSKYFSFEINDCDPRKYSCVDKEEAKRQINDMVVWVVSFTKVVDFSAKNKPPLFILKKFLQFRNLDFDKTINTLCLIRENELETYDSFIAMDFV